MEAVKIGIAGLGTVGGGTYAVLSVTHRNFRAEPVLPLKSRPWFVAILIALAASLTNE